MTFPATNLPADLRTHMQHGVGLILGLFGLRWVSGISENLGMPFASEAAASLMLLVLAVVFLQSMRIVSVAALFTAGIIFWIASALFSLAANPGIDPRASVSLLSLLALYGLFTNTAMAHIQTLDHLRKVARLFGKFVFVGLALSVLQIATNTGFVEAGRSQMQRAFGSDVHPVSFAIQLLAALVAIEVVRAKRQKPVGFAHVILLLGGLLALYLTFARTAWVMAMMVCTFAALTHGPVFRRWSIGLTAVIFSVAAMITSDRFADLSSLPVFLTNFSIDNAVFDWRFVDNSISWRIVNWSFGLRQALEAPLLGFGPGQSAQSSLFNLEMHNIFLETFFEGGIFGLLAFLICLAGLFRIHRNLPGDCPADRYARTLTNSFGLSLLFAVCFSTSFVDQLMSFLIYILLLSVTRVHSRG